MVLCKYIHTYNVAMAMKMTNMYNTHVCHLHCHGNVYVHDTYTLLICGRCPLLANRDG